MSLIDAHAALPPFDGDPSGGCRWCALPAMESGSLVCRECALSRGCIAAWPDRWPVYVRALAQQHPDARLSADGTRWLWVGW